MNKVEVSKNFTRRWCVADSALAAAAAALAWRTRLVLVHAVRHLRDSTQCNHAAAGALARERRCSDAVFRERICDECCRYIRHKRRRHISTFV